MHAAAGSSIVLPPGPLAGDRRAAELSLNTLGLCQMAGRMQRFERPKGTDGPLPLLLRRAHGRLPLPRPQAATCADSLASCAGGLTSALEAAVGLQEEGEASVERFEVRERGTRGRGGSHMRRRPQLRFASSTRPPLPPAACCIAVCAALAPAGYGALVAGGSGPLCCCLAAGAAVAAGADSRCS